MKDCRFCLKGICKYGDKCNWGKKNELKKEKRKRTKNTETFEPSH